MTSSDATRQATEPSCQVPFRIIAYYSAASQRPRKLTEDQLLQNYVAVTIRIYSITVLCRSIHGSYKSHLRCERSQSRRRILTNSRTFFQDPPRVAAQRAYSGRKENPSAPSRPVLGPTSRQWSCSERAGSSSSTPR